MRPTGRNRTSGVLMRLVVERIPCLEQRFKQLGKSPVPVGQRVRRLADQHHLENAGHDGHQPVAACVSLATAADGAFLQRQPVQDPLHILRRSVRLRRDVRRRAPAQTHSSHRTTSASSSVNVCSTKAISSSQIGGPISSGLDSRLAAARCAGRDARIVRQPLLRDRLGPRPRRTNQVFLDDDDLPWTMFGRHAW